MESWCFPRTCLQNQCPGRCPGRQIWQGTAVISRCRDPNSEQFKLCQLNSTYFIPHSHVQQDQEKFGLVNTATHRGVQRLEKPAALDFTLSLSNKLLPVLLS
jgi:hypothetical protein